MGWNDMGDQEAAKLLGIVRDNLDAILTSRKDGKP
jgi:hypothetical protein